MTFFFFQFQLQVDVFFHIAVVDPRPSDQRTLLCTGFNGPLQDRYSSSFVPPFAAPTSPTDISIPSGAQVLLNGTLKKFGPVKVFDNGKENEPGQALASALGSSRQITVSINIKFHDECPFGYRKPKDCEFLGDENGW